MDNLITDRTYNDVILGTDKGYYNYTDLNRVEEATAELAQLLTAQGYYTAVEQLEIEDSSGTTLPGGYTDVDYIESTGTQYINTGFKPDQDTRIVCDFQLISTSGWRTVFGVWSLSGGSYINAFTFLATSGGVFSSYYGNSQVSFSADVYTTERYIVDKNKNSCEVGTSTVLNTTSTFSQNNNLYLFSGNTDGVASELSGVRIYSCEIYNNDTLVHNFIPCLNLNGKPCLYDTVTKQDYLNSGTGEFIYPEGTVIVPTTRNEWETQDIPTVQQMARYLNNVKLCVRQFNAATGIELPESMELLDYIGANNIEKVLLKINELLDYMIEVLRYSGTFYSGSMDSLRGYCL